MTLLELTFLSLIQGITEFLPISSSAHLILARELLTWMGLSTAVMTPGEELALDIALHVGSLGAVLVYFRRDVVALAVGGGELLLLRQSERSRLFLKTVVASLPIVFIGFVLKDLITASGRSALIIAFMTIIFGLMLWAADQRPENKARVEDLSFRDALMVGLAQCFAVIPGVSRSGICMTAGRFMGLNRSLSASFAMLLSIPAILGSGLLATLDLVRSGNVALTSDAVVGAGLSLRVPGRQLLS